MSSSTRFVRHTLGIALLALPLQAQGGPGGGGGNASVIAYIQTLPLETIDTNEQWLLTHMREEEKLARDVYRTLFQRWQVPIFQNIAQSEQSHMDLVAFALDRYQLPDPVVSDQVGVFTDPLFTLLYDFATTLGQVSLSHALLVGALIEDLDIVDLEHALYFTDNRDIDTVWQNLMKGSRNHYRAFHPQLAANGYYYPGFFTDPTILQAILATPNETGALDEDGNPL
ncbi:MAG: DUF2202 domain-containing protein [Planctomycetes bacterium]|nr:DUF2202 domain-containing protein [Planctomycetota bacterium]